MGLAALCNRVCNRGRHRLLRKSTWGCRKVKVGPVLALAASGGPLWVWPAPMLLAWVAGAAHDPSHGGCARGNEPGGTNDPVAPSAQTRRPSQATKSGAQAKHPSQGGTA